MIIAMMQGKSPMIPCDSDASWRGLRDSEDVGLPDGYHTRRWAVARWTRKWGAWRERAAGTPTAAVPVPDVPVCGRFLQRIDAGLLAHYPECPAR